jgi:hypothetical protein
VTADDPEPGGGERLWPGLVVVAVLAIALAAVVFIDRDDPPLAPASTIAPTPSSVKFGADPTLLPTPTQVATTTVVSLPATNQMPTTTQLPTTTQPPPTTAVPETTIAEVTTTSVVVSPIEAARDALSAWGRFAVSGDLDRLDGFFHPDGPQWRQLAAEAETLADEPPGPPRYTVTLRQPRIVERGRDRAVVRGRVTFARRGETTQRYRWDLVMVPGDEGDWLLWTAAERG